MIDATPFVGLAIDTACKQAWAGEDTEELVGVALEALARCAKKFDGRGSFPGFMTQRVRWAITDWRRTSGRSTDRDLEVLQELQEAEARTGIRRTSPAILDHVDASPGAVARAIRRSFPDREIDPNRDAVGKAMWDRLDEELDMQAAVEAPPRKKRGKRKTRIEIGLRLTCPHCGASAYGPHCWGRRTIRCPDYDLDVTYIKYHCLECSRFFSDPRIGKFAPPGGRYSHSLIAEAVRIARTCSTLYSASAHATKRFGIRIPPSTLHGWIQDAPEG